MKRNDWILIGVIIAVSGIIYITHLITGGRQAETVTVYVDGREWGQYSLNEDQEIPIHDTNTLLIEDGQARMKWADCPDQLCVHQKAISRNKESIICLPNQVVAEVSGAAEKEIDAVTRRYDFEE